MITNPPVDATHDPSSRSWVDSANDPACDFPIQNLPFGRFRRRGSDEPWRIGVAIGDQILDLMIAAQQCPWAEGVHELLAPLAAGDLAGFMAAGTAARRRVREALSAALADGSDQGPFLELCLLAQAEAELALPCRIGGFTDFDAGLRHAAAVGRLLRPDDPPWAVDKRAPIGRHGRASSIVASGTPVRRPMGPLQVPGAAAPSFGPSERLDCELGLGVLIGRGNALGEPLTMEQAEQAWFGMLLLNAWTARDIQAWEARTPSLLLAKGFATTISPWVVTAEALAPYRVPFARPEGDPPPLPYLNAAFNSAAGAIDIGFEVWLQTSQMRVAGTPPHKLVQGSLRDSDWTVAQLIAHHTSGGCNLCPGDLLGSGTPSGPDPHRGGSLLELTEGGRVPLTLPGGQTRTFLQDGDTVILRAHCRAPGRARIGFGEAVGTVVG
jgi:fumarylacetoacetase